MEDVGLIHHVADVARRVAQQDKIVVAIAWLHDVVEDTEVSLEDIERAFGRRVRDGVDAMTRREGEDYLTDYLLRLRAMRQTHRRPNHVVKRFEVFSAGLLILCVMWLVLIGSSLVG